jgi:uracil-DNA glycosylase
VPVSISNKNIPPTVMQNAMKMTNDILKFQQECFKHYLNDIREKIIEFPEKYLFPDGNPILPILPVKTEKKKIMFVGAFPSARFENRNGLLIPTANNLSPFGKEEYFDGQQIRKQASREVLEEEFFSKLNINADEHWITDLVKVYLMPEKHIKNCIQINPNIKYVDTHKLLKRIAIASKEWFYREVEICKPRLIITFGEVVARVIKSDFNTENRELLNGQIKQTKILGTDYNICHLPHPEIVRRNKEWRDNNSKIMRQLSQEISNLFNKN